MPDSSKLASGSDQAINLLQLRPQLADRLLAFAACVNSRRLVALLLLAAMACTGCIGVPISDTRSIAMPDLAPLIPPDLQSQPDTLLVILQRRTEEVPSSPANASKLKLDAAFVRGVDLVQYSGKLQGYADVGYRWYFLPLIGGANCFICKTAQLGVTRTELLTLCVIDRRGAQMWISPYRDTTVSQGPYAPALITAFADSLNSAASTRLDLTAAPCNVSGEVAWPVELRQRVVEYLRSIAATQ